MIQYKTIIHKFDEQGEKTGWTYIEIPADLAQELFPGNKKSFRVKGMLDKFPIHNVALMPMGDGCFIMAVNAQMRKGIAKKHGAMLDVKIEKDDSGIPVHPELIACLEEDEDAKQYFESLAPSHRLYFSKWISDAKTEPTKVKRLTQCILALSQNKDYGTMIREQKANRM
ncbi:DUF1905 domain-containing protein [Taibaiella lutea]|uniref:DUF1905 domain-containing protein n=1 Tax=Taibaiella lutea TaxID=2608001 RepID=A0A5M6CNL8_9BACT|nr:YdeI/OmpD-associated family protein [Taibaiella lutea]KAA5534875.1 DUF1905 domain-containing protein [Taibaiella lutea]